MVKITLAMALGIAGSALGTVPTPDPEAPMPLPAYDPDTIIDMPDDLFVPPEHQRRNGGLDPRCLIVNPQQNPCIPGNFPIEPEPKPMPTPVDPVDPQQRENKRMVLHPDGPIPTPIMPFPGPPYGPAIKGEKRGEEARMMPPDPLYTPGTGYPVPPVPFPGPVMAKGEKRDEEERMVLPPGPIPTPGSGYPRPFPNPLTDPVLAKGEKRDEEERMILPPPGPIPTPGYPYPGGPFPGGLAKGGEKRDEEERMILPPDGPIPTPDIGYPVPPVPFPGPVMAKGEKREEEERMILPPGPIPTPGYGFPPYMPIANANKRDEKERRLMPAVPIPTPADPADGITGPLFPGHLASSKSQQKARRAKRCVHDATGDCELWYTGIGIPDPVEPENQRRGNKLDARCLVADPRLNPCIPGNYHLDE